MPSVWLRRGKHIHIGAIPILWRHLLMKTMFPLVVLLTALFYSQRKHQAKFSRKHDQASDGFNCTPAIYQWVR